MSAPMQAIVGGTSLVFKKSDMMEIAATTLTERMLRWWLYARSSIIEPGAGHITHPEPQACGDYGRQNFRVYYR